MEVKENHILVNKTARYYTLGELTEQTKSVCFLLHGHGHNAKSFLGVFKSLWGPDKLFIAPEGLNRYYLKGYTGGVGATWMTKEDRLNEIKDYIHYLDDLYEYFELDRFTGSITALGFSQGGSTATRWVAASPHRFTNVVVYAGEVGAELLPLQPSSGLLKTKNYFLYGTGDEFFPPDRIAAMKASYSSLNFTETVFDGGHEVKTELLKQII